MGAVAVDRPTLFIQGTILVLALVSVLIIADNSHGLSPFVAQAAAVPGSSEEREAQLQAGAAHTEIYPLTLFAVGGMLLFPAANDLLTMFVALEILSLPLYLLCGLARRRRLLSQEAAIKYFLLGAFSSAFFLFGIALLYGYAGSVQLSGHRHRGLRSTANETLLLRGHAPDRAGPAVQDRRGAVPGWKPDVYQGAPTPITALMASCTLVSAFGALLRVFYVAFDGLPLGLAAGHVGRRHPHHGRRRGHRRSPRPTSSGCWPTPRSRTPATSWSASSRPTPQGLSSTPVLPGRYGFSTVGAFALITLVRDAGRRGQPPVPLGRPGQDVPADRRHRSRSSCSPSPASR